MSIPYNECHIKELMKIALQAAAPNVQLYKHYLSSVAFLLHQVHAIKNAYSLACSPLRSLYRHSFEAFN